MLDGGADGDSRDRSRGSREEQQPSESSSTHPEAAESSDLRLLSTQRWPRRLLLCLFSSAALALVLIAIAGIVTVTAAPAGLLPSSARRQVFVLRHCVRSSSSMVKRAKDGVLDPAAYTSHPLPAWGVPPKWCTPIGMDILKGTGADLQRLAGDVSALRVISDTSMRDADSALALLQGLEGAAAVTDSGEGFQASVAYDPIAFDTLEPDKGLALCEAQFTDDDLAATVRARLASIPPPQPISEAEQELEALIGVGRAGPLAALGAPTVHDDGSLHGSVAVLKHFGQMLLYTFASGMPAG